MFFDVVLCFLNRIRFDPFPWRRRDFFLLRYEPIYKGNLNFPTQTEKREKMIEKNKCDYLDEYVLKKVPYSFTKHFFWVEKNLPSIHLCSLASPLRKHWN